MRKIFFGKKSMWNYIHEFTKSHGNTSSDTIYRYSKMAFFPIYILHELKEDIL